MAIKWAVTLGRMEDNGDVTTRSWVLSGEDADLIGAVFEKRYGKPFMNGFLPSEHVPGIANDGRYILDITEVKGK